MPTFGEYKNRQESAEHMLDRFLPVHDDKTVLGLEDIKTIFAKIVIQFIFIQEIIHI